MAFDGCCPDCKFPGDDCPLIWGSCNHAFHLHCILKWVNSQTSTPLCPMAGSCTSSMLCCPGSRLQARLQLWANLVVNCSFPMEPWHESDLDFARLPLRDNNCDRQFGGGRMQLLALTEN
uniref:Anaphase-promoting complex subunit 11 n=1 Tax=Oryza glumipatula TaxID=40148 RepID=A0A0D9Z640_9ORYZ